MSRLRKYYFLKGYIFDVATSKILLFRKVTFSFFDLILETLVKISAKPSVYVSIAIKILLF